MSGGSMDYFHCKLEALIADSGALPQTTPERKLFVEHLQKVADALYAIEMVDSGNFGTGDETAAILNCLGTEEEINVNLVDVVDLLQATKIGLEQVGKQDSYIDYTFSSMIKKRVDCELKRLKPLLKRKASITERCEAVLFHQTNDNEHPE